MEVELQLCKIRLLALDVDGTLTDGGMYYSDSGDQMKRFDAKDGRAILKMPKYDIVPCVISTGSRERIIRSRCRDLGIEEFVVNCDHKGRALEQIQAKLGISRAETLAIGDDVNDFPMFDAAAISFCPADAHPDVLAIANKILRSHGGQGAVREALDLIFRSKVRKI